MFHPLVNVAARRRATLEAMDTRGLSRWEARRKFAEPTDEQISEVIRQKCVEFGVVPPSRESLEGGLGAIGDGTIIKAISDFCKEHPELISAIVKALFLLVGL